MKKKVLNFPCQCGHKELAHSVSPLYMGGDTYCLGDNFKETNPTKIFACDCEKYIPDNLKYLEQMSKKKGKGN